VRGSDGTLIFRNAYLQSHARKQVVSLLKQREQTFDRRFDRTTIMLRDHDGEINSGD